MLLEEAGQGQRVWNGFAHGMIQIENVRGIRAQPSQQTGAGWRANCLLAIGVLKQDSLARQPVYVGRDHVRVAITTQLRAQVVHGNEQDVWRMFGGRRRAVGENRTGNTGASDGQQQNKAPAQMVYCLVCFQNESARFDGTEKSPVNGMIVHL